MEQEIAFQSAGNTLSGFLHVPDGVATAQPALILLHGFGGSCRGAGHPELAAALERAGYVALRFDYRGCGKSDGERGSVICEEEIADTHQAIAFLGSQPNVDATRIGLIGASLGGSVAIEVTAADPRVKVCAANGAIGNGERRFRAQYPDPAKWQSFRTKLDDARRRKATLNRFEIIQIPEPYRKGLPPGATMEFSAETAISLMALNPEAVVGRIAPRPLLLIHPRADAVVPVAETEALSAAAGANCETHIIESREHFASGSPALIALTLDWLGRHIPVA